MIFYSLLVSLIGLTFASPFPSVDQHLVFGNVTIFTPPSNWSNHWTTYARTVLLNHDGEADDILLASWSFQPPGRTYAPIYQSKDGGLSWSELSKVYFSAADKPGSIILQVFLYELPQTLGAYPAGTVLLTANAVPANHSSTNIQLYASLDKGHSFEYVSTVAVGGSPNTTNGATPVWEPMILMHEGELGVFYSDSRDPKHGQKLAHQTTVDLVNWGEVVNDAAEANYTLRPGMTTIARMGNGKFIFSYELAFAPEDPVKAAYAVHYRIADSPFEFDQAETMLLKATDGTIASSGPQTIWTPAGGPNGTVITSDSDRSEFFINHAYGDPSSWVKVESGKGVGYTRELRIMPKTAGKVILVTNGGMYSRSETIVSCGEWIVPPA
ncbi:BNR/Asp-box repeat domain protein [Tricladium varicosporioides]|nr:BNR/Asp-box repeat domain protein [Hymenoscyphus varicosporioides]